MLDKVKVLYHASIVLHDNIYIDPYKIENETYKLSTITLYTATNTDINEKVLIHIFPKEKLLTIIKFLKIK